MQGSRLAFSFGVLACIAIAASCREPTQITLRITTGEKCADLTGVQIVVGSSAEVTQTRFTQRFAAAVTHTCTPDGSGNLIGTLVVTPGTSAGTVVVSAGVNTAAAQGPDPADCADPVNAKQCIIARRSFSFIDHSSLTLPIDLDPLCVGQSCDPASTCFKGSCVSDTALCQGADCSLPQETGSGSGSDASSSDGAYDADLEDAPMSFEDARVDTGLDSGTKVEASLDASDGGIPDCYYVPVSMSMTTRCDISLGSYTQNVQCDGTPNAMEACCRCVCRHGGQSGNVVGCDVGMGIGSSCHPSSCMP